MFRYSLKYGLFGAAAAFAVFATGCQDSAGVDGSQNPPVVRSEMALKTFDTCQQLEDYIEDVAVRTMKERLENDVYRSVVMDDGATFDVAAPQAETNAGAATEKSSEPAAHTETNNQVAGVDEADFVKNDGTRIFVLSGTRLFASKSWPADELSLEGEIDIEGYPQQMALHAEKNRIVVFSSVYLPAEEDDSVAEPELRYDMPEICYNGLGYRCGYSLNATKITVVDVSDLTQLKVTQTYYLPGNYVSARTVDSSVRLVLRDQPRWPDGVKLWAEVNMDDFPKPMLDDDADQSLWQAYWRSYQEEYEKRQEKATEQLKVDNEKIIRAATLDAWLPEGLSQNAEGQDVVISYNCSDFYFSDAPVRLGLATVVTLNLDNVDSIDRASIVGEVDQIYASKESLYLSNQHWWWSLAANQMDYTYLHKFDISDPDHSRYVASGGVEGHILNQFSMDEYKGYFRIATTVDARVEDSDDLWRTTTTNRVSVLGEENGQLKVVGKTEDVAEGERIYSARFIGDKGFIVTFRQVDPLYTVDLSQPTDPKIVGELKVPGFSSYIHPLDDNHLLTIGTHIPEPVDGVANWFERAVKLTIFDVSDFANPKEKFTETIGTAHGHSEAQYEHKAFNFFAEKGLLAIPFSDYEPWPEAEYDYWSRFVSDLRLFRVSAEEGITPAGAVSMNDVYSEQNSYDWRWYYSPWVRRSVMASDDEANNFVYAITDAGIRTANIDAPQTPLETIQFPAQPLELK